MELTVLVVNYKSNTKYGIIYMIVKKVFMSQIIAFLNRRKQFFKGNVLETRFKSLMTIIIP